MQRKYCSFPLLGLLGLLVLAAACSAGRNARSAWRVTSVSHSRVLLDSGYDAAVPAAATALLQPYKRAVDSMMCPVVGITATPMGVARPESPLSNLFADALVWAGSLYGEQPHLGVCNMGAVRSSLSAGSVTYGDILRICPFKNRVTFLTLSGRALWRLMEQVAAAGGEAVSRGVCLRIGPDGRPVSFTLHGQAIDSAATYRVATIEYLADGGGRLKAFDEKTDCRVPSTPDNDFQHLLADYFRHLTDVQGRVAAATEGRIILEKP